MKAIILAAGKGTRISRMIEAIPKCTLPVGGKPLIKHTVELLQKKGMDVSICVGYRQDLVRNALEGMKVKFFYNPVFDITNSIYSLYLCKEELHGDTLILNGDVFFDEDILDKILEHDKAVVMVEDTGRIEVGDYFFYTVNGCIKKYGKDLPRENRTSEYVGIAKIKECFIDKVRLQLEKLMNEQKHNHWWEHTLYSMSDAENIFTLDIKGMFWAEIDYFDDYERILDYLEKKEENETYN